MSYDENRINDQIDGGLHEREQLILSGVRLSLDFAEWIDIYGIRNGEHEWTYKGDNYTKTYSTRQMLDEYEKQLRININSQKPIESILSEAIKQSYDKIKDNLKVYKK